MILTEITIRVRKIIADKLISYLKRDSIRAKITSVNIPQQHNKYDCDMIICWIIETLVQDIINNDGVNLEYIKNFTLSDLELVK